MFFQVLFIFLKYLVKDFLEVKDTKRPTGF